MKHAQLKAVDRISGIKSVEIGRQTSFSLSSISVKAANHSFRWDFAFLALAAINCVFQIAWFWRYSSHNINYDAISYLGIARHILDGEFRASLHGYWSPLFSWCVVAGSVFNNNLLLIARIVTVFSFLGCLPLIYLLTLHLWRSSRVASLAVLCFTLARGVVAFSVDFIGADFLLTAAVIGYFLLLLQCLREPERGPWLKLGSIHGLAFLAKAFAMPWLILSTLLAVGLLYRRPARRAFICTGLALVIPMATWIGWGLLLRVKYGSFTAGYQLKLNLLPLDFRNRIDHGALSVLTDTSQTNDEYMVVDSMYPSSPLWKAQLKPSDIPEVLQREKRNLPEAIKQVLILITPGCGIAVLLALRRLRRVSMEADTIWAWVVAFNVLSLILAYCMLVFDARYVLPVAPLLIGLGARFLWPPGDHSIPPVVKFLPISLFIGSLIFLGFYRGSPFRSFREDYQTSLYATSDALRQIPHCDRLVSIGSGPFPEHGVGWEAGIYASYFAQCRIVGFSAEMPSSTSGASLVVDIERLNANSVLIFPGAPEENPNPLIAELRSTSRFSSLRILPLAHGAVAVLLWNDR